MAELEEIRRQEEFKELQRQKLREFGEDIRKPGGKLTYKQLQDINR